MKLLRFSDQKNSFDSRVHMIVTRTPDIVKDTADLIAVGLVDVDSAARAIVARILKGEKTRLYYSTSLSGSPERKILADKYMYRFVTRPIGKLTHAVVIHKSAVDESLPEGSSRVLLSPNGDNVEELFLRRFSNDFNLPYVEAWRKPIWEACSAKSLVTELSVWTDPKVPFWNNLKAFEMSADLTEEVATGILSDLLADEIIELPEGITDAPSLEEALKPDEESGEVRVTDYLQTYAGHLATSIEDIATPAHDLDQPIDPAIAQMARVPFPAQAHTVQAVLKGFDSSKGTIVSSDMGTGKSIVALATANALSKRSSKGFAALLLVPGITIPKWIRDEIGKTIPGAKVTHFESWHDVVRYRNERVLNRKKEQIEFVLLSRDTAKFGMPKAPALIYKKRWIVPNKATWDDAYKSAALIEDVWLCPDCGGIQQKTTKTAQREANKHHYEIEQLRELKLGFEDLASDIIEHKDADGKTHQQYVWRKSVTEYHCSECENNLMRFVLPDKESVSGLKKRRMQPAWLIQKYLRNWFDLVIIDELHQYKSASGQGEAMGAISGASKRVLGLTGTLSDGKASSLYHLLWRIAPNQMKADGMDHRSLNKFVHLYGTMEQKGRYAKDEVSEAGGATDRKIIMNPPKEVPGLSPRLFVNFLADKCVFLELGDLGLPLVELEERPVFIDMDEDHQDNYTVFHNELEATMRQQFAIGNQHAFAKFIPSTVNASNQPHASQEVVFGDDSVVFFAPNHHSQLSAKERKLVEDIRDELTEGRRCVVYVRYSGDASQDRRIADILKREGVRVQVLQANVSPEERVEWLEQAVDKGTEVVVCNAKLVEVGLDLLSFPTLLFYQFTDEVNTMRQAARRSWRIAQHRRCKVLYYTYNRSYEMVQFKRMLAKRSHSMLLEGRLDKSEVASFVERDDKSASTFAIANCLGNVEDLTQRWKTLADKDIPAGVAMLEEEQFKQEIVLAMKRLSSETRRLAGVPEPEEVTIPMAQEPVIMAVPKAAPRVHGKAEGGVVLPLFATMDSSKPETVNPAPSTDYSPLTVGDLRNRMGMVDKAKRAKSKINDNQIALFAFDAV